MSELGGVKGYEEQVLAQLFIQRVVLGAEAQYQYCYLATFMSTSVHVIRSWQALGSAYERVHHSSCIQDTW